MATKAISVFEHNTPFKDMFLDSKKRVRVIRRVIRKPLLKHRTKLNRGWFTPDDWAEVHEIATWECRKAGMRPDDSTLYIESNKLASEIANELFPNKH